MKPASASRVALANASGISPSLRTMRIPRPPPPPLALRMTGKPIRFASSTACAASRRTPLPGRRGNPYFFAFSRAVTLSPHARIAAGVGPMKVILHLAHSSANAAFSERKP